MKQTEQQQGNEDLVLLIWQIEKLRRREGGCTMNELISEAKKNFEGIEQIKTKKIMEQTAVEYLVNQFRDAIGDSIINVMTEEIEQAKEMEKQHIIDAYRRSTYQFEVDAKINCRTAEEYYNETYNQ
jgi:hypothetical protein